MKPEHNQQSSCVYNKKKCGFWVKHNKIGEVECYLVVVVLMDSVMFPFFSGQSKEHRSFPGMRSAMSFFLLPVTDTVHLITYSLA